MRTLLFVTALIAVGCDGGELTEEAEVAKAVCDAYCEQCSEYQDCARVCFVDWSLFGGSSTKAVCATQYLVGLECRMEHGCDDPGCGDPYEDMFRCAEDID